MAVNFGGNLKPYLAGGSSPSGWAASSLQKIRNALATHQSNPETGNFLGTEHMSVLSVVNHSG